MLIFIRSIHVNHNFFKPFFSTEKSSGEILSVRPTFTFIRITPENYISQQIHDFFYRQNKASLRLCAHIFFRVSIWQPGLYCMLFLFFTLLPIFVFPTSPFSSLTALLFRVTIIELSVSNHCLPCCSDHIFIPRLSDQLDTLLSINRLHELFHCLLCFSQACATEPADCHLSSSLYTDTI